MEIPVPSPRARGLSEDQRIRLRDLEQTSHLTEYEVGEAHALRATGTSEERTRADRVLARARSQASANKSDQSYTPGLLGSTPRQQDQQQ
jgi:hypothetical protein